MMKTRLFGNRRGLAIIGCFLLAAGLFACGGSGDSNCTTNPTGPGCVSPTTTLPPPPPPVVVTQGASITIEADFILRVPFTTTQAGKIEVTADWTFATNDVDVLIARGNCSFDQLEAEACDIAVLSASETAKPERINLTGAAAGAYTLFIANFGPTHESVSFQVVLTPGAGSASASRVSGLSLPDRVQRLRGRLELP